MIMMHKQESCQLFFRIPERIHDRHSDPPISQRKSVCGGFFKLVRCAGAQGDPGRSEQEEIRCSLAFRYRGDAERAFCDRGKSRDRGGPLLRI